MLTIPEFAQAKAAAKPIVMLTCYDAPSARLLAQTTVDAVLVGDSVAMAVHGYPSTIGATVEMIATHVKAVRAGNATACLVADVPFLAARKDRVWAVETAQRLMQAGANAIKIEGRAGLETIIPHLVEAGVPVMGHLGLTPQSFNVLGGYKVQGQTEMAAQAMRADAELLETWGCFSLVLECVPAPLARQISSERGLVTIGIGAGSGTDGQILVWHDLLGLSDQPLPRFVRRYSDLAGTIRQAVETWADDVRSGQFPNQAESYGLSPQKQES